MPPDLWNYTLSIPGIILARLVGHWDMRLLTHRQALKNGDIAASANAENAFEADHQVDLSKATAIDHHPHTQTHRLLESWHMQPHQATLNRDRGFV